MGLNKQTLHWTGGLYTPNKAELKAYHVVIAGSGEVHTGDLAPEANINVRDGVYARHAGGFNTGNIGTALACMSKAKEHDPTTWRVPPRLEQFKAATKEMAQMSLVYNIAPKRCWMHSEIRPLFGRGIYKWDVNLLPWVSDDLLSPTQAGDYLRECIANELRTLKRTGPKVPWWRR